MCVPVHACAILNRATSATFSTQHTQRAATTIFRQYYISTTTNCNYSDNVNYANVVVTFYYFPRCCARIRIYN